MTARHIAAPSPLMLAAEEIEQATCTAMADAGDTVHAFDTGRHCAVLPPLCVLGSDSDGTYIKHECGLGTERLAALA